MTVRMIIWFVLQALVLREGVKTLNVITSRAGCPIRNFNSLEESAKTTMIEVAFRGMTSVELAALVFSLVIGLPLAALLVIAFWNVGLSGNEAKA